MKQIEKPDVLSEKEIPVRFIGQTNYEMIDHRLSRIELFRIAKDEGLIQAQRDDTYQKMLDAFEPLIHQAKAEVINKIERNCKGYEDNTVGHLLASKFWQSLKSKFLEEKK